MSQDDGSSKRALNVQDRRRELRLAFFLVLLVVTVLALWPGLPGRGSLFGWDKLDHLSAFAALALLGRMTWPGLGRLYLGGALIFYGVLIEVLQATPPIQRTASLSDLVADAAGIGLGFALAWAIERLLRVFQR